MVKKSAAVHTNATKILYEANVPYAIHQYDESTSGVNADCGLPPDSFDNPNRVFRTTVVLVDEKPIAVLAPIDCFMERGLVAAAVGGETAIDTECDEASAITGFPTDAISPLGMKDPIPVLADVSILDFKTVYLSAGEQGFTIELSPTDLLQLTNARTAPIARRYT